jgi:hypothetical protein
MHDIGLNVGLVHSGGLDGQAYTGYLATWETNLSTTTHALCASTLPKLSKLVGRPHGGGLQTTTVLIKIEYTSFFKVFIIVTKLQSRAR